MSFKKHENVVLNYTTYAEISIMENWFKIFYDIAFVNKNSCVIEVSNQDDKFSSWKSALSKSIGKILNKDCLYFEIETGSALFFFSKMHASKILGIRSW